MQEADFHTARSLRLFSNFSFTSRLTLEVPQAENRFIRNNFRENPSGRFYSLRAARRTGAENEAAPRPPLPGNSKIPALDCYTHDLAQAVRPRAGLL